jgi:hypothetical protein
VCDAAAGASAIHCKSGAPEVPAKVEFCADPALRCKQVSGDVATAVTDANGLVCE